jgi:opacity protein-like surface antigen
MTKRILAFTLTASLAGLVAADAQPAPAPRSKPARTASFFLGIDGGIQATSSSATSKVTYRVYGEEASLDTTYTTEPGPVFGGHAGFRVWRRLVIGAGASLYSKSSNADVTASIPHPFHFTRPRTIEGSAPNIGHDEAAIYAEIGWLLSVSPKFDVLLFGGPAFFSGSQEVAVKAQYSESYPFDTATLTSVETVSKDLSATGFTVGADLSYRFSRNLGAGVLLRFSQAQTDVEPLEGQSFSMDLGGFQASAGLRFRF